LVVTDALHMKRAAGAFARFGYIVERAKVPAYLGYGANLTMLRAAAREAAALLYYRAKGWVAPLDRRPDKAAGGHEHRPDGRLSRGGDTAVAGDSIPSQPIVIAGASYAGGWKIDGVAGRRVINSGVSGEQTTEVLGRFERDVVAQRPRAVVLWGHINDVFRADRQRAAEAVARARRNYEQMFERAAANGIEVIVATEVTLPARRGIRERIAAVVNAVRGKESYQDWVNRHVMELNNWLRAMAVQRGMLLLDLERATADDDGRRLPAFAAADGSHITPAGYEHITAYAQPLLEQRLAVPPAGSRGSE
jgi:lysophospholipase L1-like esterase